MSPRDATRQRLYFAEAEALSHHPQRIFPSIIHVGEYVRRTVLKDKWFIRTFGRTVITVRLTRVDSRHSFAMYEQREIAINPRMMKEQFVLHEIAHMVRPLAGWARWWYNNDRDAHASHGREFAHTFLILVQHFIGEKAAKRLREAYRHNGVKYTAPRRLSPEQLAGMRERLAKYRAAQKEGCPEELLPPGWTVRPNDDAEFAKSGLEVTLRDPNGTIRGYYHGTASAGIAARALVKFDAHRAKRMAETPHDPKTCEHPHCKLAF